MQRLGQGAVSVLHARSFEPFWPPDTKLAPLPHIIRRMSLGLNSRQGCACFKNSCKMQDLRFKSYAFTCDLKLVTCNFCSAIISSAFTMATATVLPPFLPFMDIYGTSSPINPSFDSSASTKPTGTPITKAGLVLPSLIILVNSINAVGALPITTILDVGCGMWDVGLKAFLIPIAVLVTLFIFA